MPILLKNGVNFVYYLQRSVWKKDSLPGKLIYDYINLVYNLQYILVR